jgi:hypothetical protein
MDFRALLLVIIYIVGSYVLVTPLAAADEPTRATVGSLSKRIRELEKRIEVLEKLVRVRPTTAEEGKRADDLDRKPRDRSYLIFDVVVSHKQFERRNPEDDKFRSYMWYDCTYHPKSLLKPTRAVKGVLEFSDLFGDVRFRMQVTLNERIEPDIPFETKNVGFEFNEYQDDHMWMHATDTKDMAVSFKVLSVMYADGTTEQYP